MNEAFEIWITLKGKYPTFKDFIQVRGTLYDLGIDHNNPIGIALTETQMKCVVKSIKKTFLVPSSAKLTNFMGFKIMQLDIKEG